MRAVIGAIFLTLAATTNADTTSKFTLPNGVDVAITEAEFSGSGLKVQGCTGTTNVCLIAGHIPFGVDLNLPSSYVKSITASFKGRTYSLDSTDMYNAWGKRPLAYPNPKTRYFGGKCPDESNCQFRGLFSDASGSFVAEWLIVNGVSFRTVLSSSNDLIGIFINNIDPPEFE